MAENQSPCGFMYFEPKGKIIGETADHMFKQYDAFELISFEMKAENKTNIGSAEGGRGGKVKFENFSIKKWSDHATAMLFKEMCATTQFSKAVVTFMRDAQPFLELTFRTVTVAEINLSQDGNEEPTESVTFDYGSVNISYLALDDTGHVRKVVQSKWSRIKGEAAD